MGKNTFDNLARLASVKYHERFIDNGTLEAYESPNEIIEDCLNEMKQLMLYSNYEKKDRMLNLYVYIHKEVDRYPVDLYESKQWNNIVTSVRNYLIHLEGFSIERWEKKQKL